MVPFWDDKNISGLFNSMENAKLLLHYPRSKKYRFKQIMIAAIPIKTE